MKDSSLVRAAEAVRDGRASAMVSAGNTGATMASALLRMGRIKGVARPAIATPIPVLGGTPTVLLDAGRQRRVQRRVARAVRPDGRGLRPRPLRHRPARGSALLSIGEEATKGNPLVKETHKLLAEPGWIGSTGATFVGNVEGRDLMTDAVDVVVTDGFTGNVALKTLEGGMRALVGGVLAAFDTDDATRERRRGAAARPGARSTPSSTPRTSAGRCCSGVDGVCIISHGSSSATAMVNAIRVARDLVAGEVVEHLRGRSRLDRRLTAA